MAKKLAIFTPIIFLLSTHKLLGMEVEITKQEEELPEQIWIKPFEGNQICVHKRTLELSPVLQNLVLSNPNQEVFEVQGSNKLIKPLCDIMRMSADKKNMKEIKLAVATPGYLWRTTHGYKVDILRYIKLIDVNIIDLFALAHKWEVKEVAELLLERIEYFYADNTINLQDITAIDDISKVLRAIRLGIDVKTHKLNYKVDIENNEERLAAFETLKTLYPSRKISVGWLKYLAAQPEKEVSFAELKKRKRISSHDSYDSM